MKRTIETYIKKFLVSHDRLIVPGLGAFFIQYKPAWFSEDKTKIFSPSRALSFNTALKKTDGIIEGYIAEQEGVSKEEASRLLKFFVNKIDQILDQKGTIYLEGLGTFVLEEGRPVFTADEGLNFLPDSWGLTEIDLSAFGKVPEGFETREISSKKDHKPQRVYDRSRNIKRVLIFTPLVAILVFVLIYLNMEKNGTGGDVSSLYDQGQYLPPEKPKQEKPKDKKEKQKDTGQIHEEELIGETIESMNERKNALLYQEPRIVERYYLIAGSFRKMENARNFQNELDQKGFKSTVLKAKEKELYRISLRGFNDKSRAIQAMNELKHTKDMPLWVLTQEEKFGE